MAEERVRWIPDDPTWDARGRGVLLELTIILLVIAEVWG